MGNESGKLFEPIDVCWAGKEQVTVLEKGNLRVQLFNIEVPPVLIVGMDG